MRKNKSVIRLSSALLIVILSLGMFACKSNEKENVRYDENQRLEITEIPAEYSEEFINSAKERFAKTAISLKEKFSGVKFTDQIKETEKNNLENEFKTTLIPFFERIKIYETEIESILSSMEDAAKEESTEEGFSLAVRLYESLVLAVGSERSGMLLYDLTENALNKRLESAKDRYDKYGYPMLLEQAERYQALCDDLDALGEEKFVNALKITSFLNATLSNLNHTATESAFNLSDAELLLILDTQGKLFTELCPTENEWKSVGAIASEFIPDSPTDMTSAILYALKNDGYFTEAAPVMPHAFALYASVVSRLNENGKFSLSANEKEKEAAILTAISESEQELKNLDVVLTVYAKTDSERLKNAVTSRADVADLDSFIQKYEPIGYEELINAINEAKEKGFTDVSARELLISYVSQVSPYLAYAIFTN